MPFFAVPREPEQAGERELVPLSAQRPHDLPRIHGETALAAVEGNAGDEKSHAGKSSKNRRARQGECSPESRENSNIPASLSLYLTESAGERRPSRDGHARGRR